MKKLTIVLILIVQLSLFTFHLTFAHSESIKEENADQSPRKIDVDRQGITSTAQLPAPLALGHWGLGIATLLFTLPLLPALLFAPMTIAGIAPSIGQYLGSGSSGSGVSSGGPSFLQSLFSSPQSSSEPMNSMPVQIPGATPNGPVPSADEPETASSETFSSIASNALKGISELFLKRRNSRPSLESPIDVSIHKPDQMLNVPSQNRFGSFISSLRDAYNILKSGLRRYEITESDCQSRLICEMHQKAIGRSYHSITSSLLDLIGNESKLEKSEAFSARTMSVIKDFVRAAKTGLSNNDCAVIFYRCPVNANIGIESPNAIFGGGYAKPKPIQNFDKFFVHQQLNQQLNAKPLRTAIKTPFNATPPRTVHYYSNINKSQ